MQIILLDKVPNLGSLGEKVNVKAGYARNFLLPNKKAVVANKENIALFEARRIELENTLASAMSLSQERAKKLIELEIITIYSKAGEGGKLFGSVGSRHIAEVITSKGIQVAKNEVRLPNGVLRSAGHHEVNIYTGSGVSVKLIVNIISE